MLAQRREPNRAQSSHIRHNVNDLAYETYDASPRTYLESRCKEGEYLTVKRTLIALVAALLATGAAPVLAASSIDVPVASNAPTIDPRADEMAFDPAAIAQLSWNTTKSNAASESTTARVVTDGKFLYVRFDAQQNERIGSDDAVWVDFWPSGANGTFYRFAAMPDGTPKATASNGATVPAWQTSGATFVGGYTVTMKIPLAALRGAQASGPWNVQFARSIGATGQQLVWSHGEAVASADDVAQAGTMTLPASVGSL